MSDDGVRKSDRSIAGSGELPGGQYGIKGQPEGVNCIRFTQLTHSHRVTTPLTSVKIYNCLPLPKRLPRGGLFTPDYPITVRNTCALKAG